MLIFRKEIKQKICGARLFKHKDGSIEFDSDKRQEIIDPRGSADELKDDKDELMYALKDFNTPTMVKQISEDLLKNIDSVPEAKRVNLLILRLAEARVDSHFERTYRLIYSSQIKMLKYLNTVYEVNRDKAQELFQSYHSYYDNEIFESWLKFLKKTLLIQEINNSFQITEIGKDFLVYLTKYGLPEEKTG